MSAHDSAPQPAHSVSCAFLERPITYRAFLLPLHSLAVSKLLPKKSLTEFDRMRVNEARRRERLTAFIGRDEDAIRQLERYRDDPQVKEGIHLARRRIWANRRALEEMG